MVTTLPNVRGFALKAGLTETEADEVVQETTIAVARHVPEFRYDPNQSLDAPTAQYPFPRDHGPRLAWKFSNDDYNYVTGGGNGNSTTVRPDPTGTYTGGRTFTAASARLLSNGQVLIASRTAGNMPPSIPCRSIARGSAGFSRSSSRWRARITSPHSRFWANPIRCERRLHFNKTGK